MRRIDPRPLFACATTILCLGILSAGLNPVLNLAAAIPLLFYLPGWSVLRAFDAEPNGWLEAVTLRVTLSLAVVVTIGLLLHCVDSITKPSWLAAIGSATLAGCIVSIFTSRPASGKAWFLAWARSVYRPGQLLMMAIAAVVAAAALVVSVDFATRHPEFRYTQLWIVAKQGVPDEVVIGLRNAEAGDETYAIELLVDGRLVQSWKAVALKQGENWEAAFRWTGLGEYPRVEQTFRQSVTSEEPSRRQVLQRAPLGAAPRIEALVYRSGDRSTVYRRVWTAPECSAGRQAQGRPPCES
jgi:uncharacterized membrane protein